jgi:hypothetical protein
MCWCWCWWCVRVCVCAAAWVAAAARSRGSGESVLAVCRICQMCSVEVTVRQGCTRPGPWLLAGPGPVPAGLVWSGLVWSGLVWSGRAIDCSVRGCLVLVSCSWSAPCSAGVAPRPRYQLCIVRFWTSVGCRLLRWALRWLLRWLLAGVLLVETLFCMTGALSGHCVAVRRLER